MQAKAAGVAPAAAADDDEARPRDKVRTQSMRAHCSQRGAAARAEHNAQPCLCNVQRERENGGKKSAAVARRLRLSGRVPRRVRAARLGFQGESKKDKKTDAPKMKQRPSSQGAQRSLSVSHQCKVSQSGGVAEGAFGQKNKCKAGCVCV